MPNQPPRLCPGCGHRVTGRCVTCTPVTRRQHDAFRGTSASRGYGSKWRRVIRPAFLRANPLCVLCGELAEVPDHWPETRRALVARGVEHPDAFEFLRPLCTPCHNRLGARD